MVRELIPSCIWICYNETKSPMNVTSKRRSWSRSRRHFNVSPSAPNATQCDAVLCHAECNAHTNARHAIGRNHNPSSFTPPPPAMTSTRSRTNRHCRITSTRHTRRYTSRVLNNSLIVGRGIRIDDGELHRIRIRLLLAPTDVFGSTLHGLLLGSLISLGVIELRYDLKPADALARTHDRCGY